MAIMLSTADFDHIQYHLGVGRPETVFKTVSRPAPSWKPAGSPDEFHDTWVDEFLATSIIWKSMPSRIRYNFVIRLVKMIGLTVIQTNNDHVVLVANESLIRVQTNRMIGYTQKGQLHRLDGPALYDRKGRVGEYYVNGKPLSKNDIRKMGVELHKDRPASEADAFILTSSLVE